MSSTARTFITFNRSERNLWTRVITSTSTAISSPITLAVIIIFLFLTSISISLEILHERIKKEYLVSYPFLIVIVPEEVSKETGSISKAVRYPRAPSTGLEDLSRRKDWSFLNECGSKILSLNFTENPIDHDDDVGFLFGAGYEGTPHHALDREQQGGIVSRIARVRSIYIYI